MKKYNVEFWVAGNQFWDGYDEMCNMECDSAEEAIDLAIDWSIEHDIRYGDVDVDIIRAEYEDMRWRATEVLTDEDGYVYLGDWEVR
jgi:hypothetical protein